MKIKAKLLTGFLITALLCAAVGILGFTQLERMKTEITAMTTKTIPAMNHLNVVAKEFLNIKVAVRNLANPDSLEMTGFISEQMRDVEKARTVYRKSYEAYGNEPKTSDEERLWATVQQHLQVAAAYTNRTIAESEKLLSLRDEGEIAQQKRAINSYVFGPDKETFDTLVVSLNDLIGYVERYYGNEMTGKALETASLSIYVIIAASVFSFAAALLIGFGLGNAISRSLLNAVRVLDKVATGDLSESLIVRTKDEFRQVSASLDTVITTIKALVSDANAITEACIEGKLSTRADVNRFKGGYREVVTGINAIIDTLIGFIDTIPAPVMIIDQNFEVTFMNKAGAALGGSSGEQLVQARRKCHEFFKTSDCKTPNCACSRAMQTGSGASSETRATPLSDTYDIAYTGVPIRNKEGKIVGALEVITDQTAIKTAERKMKKIAAFQDEEISRLNTNLQRIAKGNLECDFNLAEADADTTETRAQFEIISAALKESVSAIGALVEDANMLAEAAVAGALQTRANAEQHQGDYRKIVEGVNRTLDLVVGPINETIAVMKKLADGDLTMRITGEYRGDFDILKTALNDSLDAINDTLGQINIAVDQVAEGSVQVSQASQALSQGASEQASSLEEITSSSTEISSQTKQNTENAVKVNSLAQEAQENAEKGNQQMKELVKAMNDINESAESIKKVVKTIDDISFQINLLALNANVEAARAGKYGKGFAVVAEEVRNLAVRSAESVKDTTRMVEEAISNIQKGNTLVEGTAVQLDEIVKGSSQVVVLAEEVAIAGREQTQGLEQISLGLNQIDQVTQSNTASAEESASASEELSSQAQQVKSMLSRFKLKAAESKMNTSELMALVRSELASREAQKRAGAVRPVPADTTKKTPAAKPAHTVHPADIISLDDNNFGKF